MTELKKKNKKKKRKEMKTQIFIYSILSHSRANEVADLFFSSCIYYNFMRICSGIQQYRTGGRRGYKCL